MKKNCKYGKVNMALHQPMIQNLIKIVKSQSKESTNQLELRRNAIFDLFKNEENKNKTKIYCI